MELKNQTHNLENINEQFYLCMYPIIMSQMEYNWTVSSLPYLSTQLYYVPEGWLVRRGSHDHWNHLAHIRAASINYQRRWHCMSCLQLSCLLSVSHRDHMLRNKPNSPAGDSWSVGWSVGWLVGWGCVAR